MLPAHIQDQCVRLTRSCAVQYTLHIAICVIPLGYSCCKKVLLESTWPEELSLTFKVTQRSRLPLNLKLTKTYCLANMYAEIHFNIRATSYERHLRFTWILWAKKCSKQIIQHTHWDLVLTTKTDVGGSLRNKAACSKLDNWECSIISVWRMLAVKMWMVFFPLENSAQGDAFENVDIRIPLNAPLLTKV